MQYWINQNGIQAGPVSLEELKTMHLTEDAYVWRSGLSDWQRITTVDELRDIFNSRYAPAASAEDPVPEPQPAVEPESVAEPEPVAEPVPEPRPVSDLQEEDTVMQPQEEVTNEAVAEESATEEVVSEDNDNLPGALVSSDTSALSGSSNVIAEDVERQCPPVPPILPAAAEARQGVPVVVGVPVAAQSQSAQEIVAGQRELPPCPPTNLVWAIVCTVLCCLPAGAIGIFTATKVNKAYRQGDYAKAEKYSEWTAWLCIASIILGLIWSPIQSCISMISMM